jgi:hypothetical protein
MKGQVWSCLTSHLVSRQFLLRNIEENIEDNMPRRFNYTAIACMQNISFCFNFNQTLAIYREQYLSVAVYRKIGYMGHISV